MLEIEHIKADMDVLRKDVRIIRDDVLRARAGLRVLVVVGSILTAVVSFADRLGLLRLFGK